MQCIAKDNKLYIEQFQSFMSEVVFTATIGDDTPAAQQGLSGEYYFLEVEDWTFDSTNSLLDKLVELQGKPKTIVLMKDGVISKHHFKDAFGAEMGLKYITKEEKAQITEAYNKWKLQNPL